MTINIAQPGHISTKALAGAFAGAVLAGAAGFGLVTMLSDDGAVTAPGDLGRVVNTEGARDSWEGRINPAPVTEDGVRDSWMPRGATGQKPQQPR